MNDGACGRPITTDLSRRSDMLPAIAHNWRSRITAGADPLSAAPAADRPIRHDSRAR